MANRASSSPSAPPIVLVGIVLATVAGLGLVGFALFSSVRGGIADPTPTLPPPRTPLIIPTMTPIPPTATLTETPPPPTATATATEEPTPTRNVPPPTNRPAAAPPTNTPTNPPPTPANNLSPTFSVSSTSVGVNSDIWFHFTITNPSSSERFAFGFLGVTVTQGGNFVFFHESWTNHSIGPNERLVHDDRTQITQPGTYALILTICSRTYDECRAGQGWEYLSSPVTVEVH